MTATSRTLAMISDLSRLAALEALGLLNDAPSWSADDARAELRARYLADDVSADDVLDAWQNDGDTFAAAAWSTAPLTLSLAA